MTASFRHGVASGDPVADAVIIWTRVSDVAGDAEVRWRVARDEALGDLVASGTSVASGDADWTVSVDVAGLPPATTLWYGFECGGARSPVGRTRTAPAAHTSRLRIGLVCCSSWPAGFFTAYGHLARRDVDLVVHVGDYIYEGNPSKSPIVRFHDPPHLAWSLRDYRARYAQHRTDTDLQLLHQRHPMAAVWDDHEFASDAWRGGSPRHDDARHGPWEERLHAAARAYREWMPVRWPDPDAALRVYRALRWGDLVDLLLIDTRIVGRDEPRAGGTQPVVGVPERARSMLGDAQRVWLHDRLRASDTRWRVVGNQVMLAPLRVLELPRMFAEAARPLGTLADGVLVNPGQWDGYPQEREELFAIMGAVGNVVVLTGDLHSSWACELTLQHRGADPSVGVEFVAPSITSDSLSQLLIPDMPGAVTLAETLVQRENAHVKWVDTQQHGYVVVDVTVDRVQADFWHIDRVDAPGTTERWAAGWLVTDGGTRLERASAPAT